LLDFVTHPYFTEQTVEKEQGIIGQEIRMYDDHPGARLEKGLLQSLYKKNKMRIDIAGTVESISEITADVLYKCYNTFYNLRNMALVVCGNVDAYEVEKNCDKILKTAKEQTIIRDYEDEDEPREVYKKRYSCNLHVSKPMFAIGVKDTDISSDPNERMKKAYGAEILNEMLFSQSSEFYTYLYEQNLISSDLSSSYEHTKNCSFNVVSSESSEPEKVYDYFVKYIEKAKKQGLDEETFELSKRTVYASAIKSFDSTEDIANNMIYNLFDDADILDFPEVVNSITIDYVEKILNDMYKEECYAMSVVNPIGKEE
jgi:predicted Zn-dependent peptidase